MPIVLTSALLGFCGLIYEFAFAQSLSILFGHSVVQYSVTIGLFIAGMGTGAHIAEYFKDARTALWRVQLELSLLAPCALFIIWWLAVSGYSLLAQIGAYIAIVGVGALTGTELPLLFRLSESRQNGRILGADYFGMLTACLFFPLWLLPNVGVFATLLGTALLNSLVMLSLLPKRMVWTITVPALLVLGLYIEPSAREWLSVKLAAG